MSLFQTLESPCPTCGVAVVFEVVHSVNVDRRPVLRSQMLDRTFQEETCPSCGTKFRTEPEFTYLHMAGKQFLSVFPAAKLPEWQECERRSQESFDRFYGPGASPAAITIGQELTRRVAFGWEAAREKLVVQEAGIDDRSLELAKMLMLRTHGAPLLEDEIEFRLFGVNDKQDMVIGELETGSEVLRNVITVPRALLDEIEAAPEDWQPLRDQLGTSAFVDLARLIV